MNATFYYDCPKPDSGLVRAGFGLAIVELVIICLIYVCTYILLKTGRLRLQSWNRIDAQIRSRPARNFYHDDLLATLKIGQESPLELMADRPRIQAGQESPLELMIER